MNIGLVFVGEEFVPLEAMVMVNLILLTVGMYTMEQFFFEGTFAFLEVSPRMSEIRAITLGAV